ncbi:hypothetical protein JR316_0004292 [Psilocybe cubensis]|uniref:Uncharacterized protein n=2 Tax=Psilocybe cubensis TaxID=181762 RepID=A0A8H8CJH6_PSICU|nr:hypothetical protein JR316_0004292 [Psilocybe cubensis]KAH9482197.1 hypothetical protein JR316_0004292 [Psilocybe cubensis]
MPPRIVKAHHLLVKTHKLSIMLSSLPPTTTVAEIKADTLSALKSDVADDALDPFAMDPPQLNIDTVDDFELCRAKRERGRPTGEYDLLVPTKTLRDSGLLGWEAIFLQARDKETGDLLPITYTLPPVIDDTEENPSRASETTGSSSNKGKRKAQEVEDEDPSKSAPQTA